MGCFHSVFKRNSGLDASNCPTARAEYNCEPDRRILVHLLKWHTRCSGKFIILLVWLVKNFGQVKPCNYFDMLWCFTGYELMYLVPYIQTLIVYVLMYWDTACMYTDVAYIEVLTPYVLMYLIPCSACYLHGWFLLEVIRSPTGSLWS